MNNLMYVTQEDFAKLLYHLGNVGIYCDISFFATVDEYLNNRLADINAQNNTFTPFAYTKMGKYLQVAYAEIRSS
jgi:hypothetical protein